jgi:hypothetical protein
LDWNLRDFRADFMSKTEAIPFRFSVSVEERLREAPAKRWHAQFMCYPLGYFRGQGRCPGSALAQAWKNFRREVDPGQRWWTVAMGTPPVRY